VPNRERDILQRAVRAVAEQAATASAIVDEALDALWSAIIQFTTLSCRFVLPASCQPSRRECRQVDNCRAPATTSETIPDGEAVDLGPVGRAQCLSSGGRLRPVRGRLRARLWSAERPLSAGEHAGHTA